MWELVSPGLYRIIVNGELYWAFSMLEAELIIQRLTASRRAA
jgi:hypothetical protein